MALARSRTSPSVFRARNWAPCARHTDTRTAPPRTVYGVSSEKNPPVSWWVAVASDEATAVGSTTIPERWSTTSIIMPCTKFAKATPSSRGTSHAEAVWIQSQVRRHFSAAIFERHSRATTRTMRHTRTRKRARYMPENIVAYHSGKAAKVAPPAVSSHTSFPSQWGPIVRTVWVRSRSSLATRGSSMPTPKSKPSRTR